jgi:hypothetical protein
MCASMVFVEFVTVPLEHEKYCVNVSQLGHNGMHYVTRRSHWMRKDKFSVMCIDALFVESILVPPEHALCDG